MLTINKHSFSFSCKIETKMTLKRNTVFSSHRSNKFLRNFECKKNLPDALREIVAKKSQVFILPLDEKKLPL